MTPDFRDPREQSAWSQLSANPLFGLVADCFQKIYADLTEYAVMKGRNFLVTEQSMPRLHRLYRLAARRLSVPATVPVYVCFQEALRVEVVGTDGDCAIVLTGACLHAYTDRQLLALFGQALSHIRYHHVRLLNLHKFMDPVLKLIPLVGNAAAQAFKTLLLQWRQYALYTADRGAAIAACSGDAAAQTLSGAMGTTLTLSDVEALPCDGTDETEMEMNLAGKAFLQLMMRKVAVPFGMWRLKSLLAWCRDTARLQDYPMVHYASLPVDTTDPGTLYRRCLRCADTDPHSSLVLLHAAADRGEPNALAQLGQYCITGKGGLPTDVPEGLRLLAEAAEKGSAAACYGLGVCLKNGLGTVLPCDTDAAAWMFRLARDGGHPKAAAVLAAIAPKAPDKALLSQAMVWFRAGFSGGACHIREDAPHLGLTELPASLRDFLWIPAAEPVLALEYKLGPDGNLLYAIAVTPIGIYRHRKELLPFHIAWDRLLRQDMDGLVEGDTVTLRLNGENLCTYRKNSPCRQIGTLILRIRKLIS